MAETEKQLADRVLMTVTQARYMRSDVARREVDPLREQIGSGEGVENERAEAWLAVCALYNALPGKPGPDLTARWEKAIDKAGVWANALK